MAQLRIFDYNTNDADVIIQHYETKEEDVRQIADGSGQYVTIREARDILGLHEWSMRKLLEESGVTIVRLPLDRRGRWLRREDVEKLRQTLYQPVTDEVMK